MRGARRKTKRRLALILLLIVLVIAALIVYVLLRHDRLYTVTVLPTLGGKITRPCDINDHGQVAGLAQIPNGKYHLFLWDRDNGMKDLGPVHESDFYINNAGQIAGTTQDPNGSSLAFLLDPNDGRHMLGTLGGEASTAFGLNNNGQVVGFSEAADGMPYAFIWDKANGMRQLGTLGRLGGNACAINDDGQVIGFTDTINSNLMSISISSPQPCFWDSPDNYEEPLTLPASSDYPRGSGLNNEGYVLGRMFRWEKLRFWIYLWRKNTGCKWLFELEHPIGPRFLNDANQVLYGEKHYGPFYRLSPKLFPSCPQRYLWDPRRGRIPLDRYIKPEIGELLSVQGLNNKGCIIGIIRPKKGVHEQAVLLEPIPERWEK